MMTAKPGQAVLLSPASSSFDEFSGYEARGDRFAALVRGEAAPALAAKGEEASLAEPPFASPPPAQPAAAIVEEAAASDPAAYVNEAAPASGEDAPAVPAAQTPVPAAGQGVPASAGEGLGA